MSSPSPNTSESTPDAPPLRRDDAGRIDVDSVPDVIEWFLDFDPRVAVVRHPRVEDVFQWKQEQSKAAGEEVFIFNRAEDRLAIGIIQALAENPSESSLHRWITQLLGALDDASKATEATSDSYKLDMSAGASIVSEASKIPTERGQSEFLMNCWIETLCTAEVRVLGWLFKEFYGHPYTP